MSMGAAVTLLGCKSALQNKSNSAYKLFFFAFFMMRSEASGAKRIIFTVLGVLGGITLGAAVFYVYRRIYAEEPASAPELPKLESQSETEPVTQAIMPKLYLIVTKENIIEDASSLTKRFEKVNIIPMRSPKTEQIAPPKKSFFRRMRDFFFSDDGEVFEITELSQEEMDIQLDSSKNILENYNANILSRINKEKTEEKKEAIVSIREKVLELAGILPSKITLFDDCKNLFWLTVYTSGNLMIDWYAYALPLEELKSIQSEVSALSISESDVSVVRESLFAILKKYILSISKNAGVGNDITEMREKIGETLKEYKKTQEMVQNTEETCQTEKLLLALDVLSYVIPMTHESRSTIMNGVFKVNQYIENATKPTIQRQLNEYLRITKKHNENIITMINRYMQFIADFEQYVDINARSVKNIKNLEKKNDSSFEYNFSVEENPVEVIREVNRKIGLCSSVFKQYRDILNIKEDAPVNEAIIQIPEHISKDSTTSSTKTE